MADVEVRAAHNVLEACARTETIDKVVFTSSVTAVVWRNDRSNNKSTAAAAAPELDERHWTDVNFCRNFKVLAISESQYHEKCQRTYLLLGGPYPTQASPATAQPNNN